MFRAIGCLVVVVAALAGGWYLHAHFGDRLPFFNEHVTAGEAPSESGAERARSRIESLSGRSSRSYVSVAAQDIVALFFLEGGALLPASAHDVRASVSGDKLLVGAKVRAAELGEKSLLSPVVALLSDTVGISLEGGFHLLRPGVGEFVVSQLRVQDVAIPAALAATIVKRLTAAGAERPAGIASNGLPVLLPDYVADVRIASDSVLVYRRTP